MDLEEAEEILNYGYYEYEKNNFDEAIKALVKIKFHPKVLRFYIRAQYKLGFIYRDQGELELAKLSFNNIKRQFNSVLFSGAKMNIANIFIKEKNIEKALESYKDIERKDSPQIYAHAQLEIFKLSKNSNFLKKIREDDGGGLYAEAQFILGEIEFSLDAKKNFWKNIPRNSEIYIKERHQIDIVESIAKVVNNKYQDQLYGVFESISSILESLFVDNRYEQFIAHYTNLTVSKLLLTKQEGEKKFKLKSTLRLNTINLMNDPEEGLLINKLLFLDSKIVTQDSAFITCFTLHHDSLNQFRLYAKEAQQEASGLSLVLGKEFFAKEHNAASIYEKSKLERVESLDKNIDVEETNKKNALAAMPLYRCIYFDPTSGLVKVAQREEWSFRREFKLENKHQWFDENPSAEEKWQEYNQKVTEIEENVKMGLKELTELINELVRGDLVDTEKELLAEILLPLRYLLKHMAFKEEQECRIVYVTQMDNELIQYDEKINRVYIDYEPSVMEYLEKIYIAPKAKDEKMVFEYLCSRGQEIRKGKEAVKVKISQNPFR